MTVAATVRRCAGLLAMLLYIGGSSAPAVWAQGDSPPASGVQAAVPEGRDDFLADMVGRGETLPGNCVFSGGGVERTFVTATYTCGKDEVVFRLLHPEAAPADATRTEKFALVLQSGTPPPGLREALVERVRAREGGFAWVWPHGSAGSPHRVRIVPTAAAVLALTGVWLFLRRRRAAKR